MAADRITAELLDKVLRSTLAALFADLERCNWYVREHEVVNRFVFVHLIPAFQSNNLDLALLGIESPVMQMRQHPKSKLGARKDVVIWREAGDTFLKGCDLSDGLDESLREQACKPLAVMEWKNISRITPRPADVTKAHGDDIEWLRANLQGKKFDVGYAILVDQRSAPHLTCRRMTVDAETDFLILPMTAAAASGASQ